MSEIVNTCMGTSGDLLLLDTRVVAGCTIVESIQTMENLWHERCDGFSMSTWYHTLHPDTITKAKLSPFSKHVHNEKSREQNQLKTRSSVEQLTWLICCHVTTNLIHLTCLITEFWGPYKGRYFVCASEQMQHHETVRERDAHLIILEDVAGINMIKPRTPVSFDWYITQAIKKRTSAVM